MAPLRDGLPSLLGLCARPRFEDAEDGGGEVVFGARRGSGVRKVRRLFEVSLSVSKDGRQKMKYVGMVENE